MARRLHTWQAARRAWVRLLGAEPRRTACKADGGGDTGRRRKRRPVFRAGGFRVPGIVGRGHGCGARRKFRRLALPDRAVLVAGRGSRACFNLESVLPVSDTGYHRTAGRGLAGGYRAGPGGRPRTRAAAGAGTGRRAVGDGCDLAAARHHQLLDRRVGETACRRPGPALSAQPDTGKGAAGDRRRGHDSAGGFPLSRSRPQQRVLRIHRRRWPGPAMRRVGRGRRVSARHDQSWRAVPLRHRRSLSYARLGAPRCADAGIHRTRRGCQRYLRREADRGFRGILSRRSAGVSNAHSVARPGAPVSSRGR